MQFGNLPNTSRITHFNYAFTVHDFPDFKIQDYKSGWMKNDIVTFHWLVDWKRLFVFMFWYNPSLTSLKSDKGKTGEQEDGCKFTNQERLSANPHPVHDSVGVMSLATNKHTPTKSPFITDD